MGQHMTLVAAPSATTPTRERWLVNVVKANGDELELDITCSVDSLLLDELRNAGVDLKADSYTYVLVAHAA